MPADGPGMSINQPAIILMEPRSTRNIDQKLGVDEDGIPILHEDPERHAERVLVFLVYRNSFTADQTAIDKPTVKMAKKAVASIQSHIPLRRHLTPKLGDFRIMQALQALFSNGEFGSNSAIRAAYSDVTDEQILTCDPKIRDRIPSCPWPLGDDVKSNLVTVEKETNQQSAARDGKTSGEHLQISTRLTRTLERWAGRRKSGLTQPPQPSKEDQIRSQQATLDWVAGVNKVSDTIDNPKVAPHSPKPSRPARLDVQDSTREVGVPSIFFPDSH